MQDYLQGVYVLYLLEMTLYTGYFKLGKDYLHGGSYQIDLTLFVLFCYINWT